MSKSASGPGSDQDEWAALLEQLREHSTVHPQPFFYTRVQARLAARLEPVGAWLPRWARRPAYVALVSMLILAVSGDGAALRPAAATSSYPTPATSLPAR
jgi:hypothetical protein